MKKNNIEFLPNFYKGYVSLVEADNFLLAMENEYRITTQLMDELPKAKEDYSYAEGKWTIKDILVHLMDTERIMAYRALRFARGDQKELQGFEQNEYVVEANAGDRSLKDIMEEFSSLRTSTIRLFRSFDEKALAQSGIANKNRISVLALAYIIPGHEIHHRKIIQERYLK